MRDSTAYGVHSCSRETRTSLAHKTEVARTYRSNGRASYIRATQVVPIQVLNQVPIHGAPANQHVAHHA
jgi:hypothetical protein